MASERPKSRQSPDVRIHPPTRRKSAVSAEARDRDASLILQRLKAASRPESGSVHSSERRASCIQFGLKTEEVKTIKGQVKSTENVSGKGLLAADLIKNLQAQNISTQRRQSSGNLGILHATRSVSPVFGGKSSIDQTLNAGNRAKSACNASSAAHQSKSLSLPRPQSEISNHHLNPNHYTRRGSSPATTLRDKKRLANAILDKYSNTRSVSPANGSTTSLNSQDKVTLPSINRVKSANSLCPILHDSGEDADSDVSQRRTELGSARRQPQGSEKEPILARRKRDSTSAGSKRVEHERGVATRKVKSFELKSRRSSSTSESTSDSEGEIDEEDKRNTKVALKSKCGVGKDKTPAQRTKEKAVVELKNKGTKEKRKDIEIESEAENEECESSSENDDESDDESKRESSEEKSDKDSDNEEDVNNIEKNNNNSNSLQINNENGSCSEEEDEQNEIDDAFIIDEELEELSKEMAAPGMPAIDLSETQERLLQNGLVNRKPTKKMTKTNEDDEIADDVDDLIDTIDDLIEADDEDITYATKQEGKKKSFKNKVKMVVAAERLMK